MSDPVETIGEGTGAHYCGNTEMKNDQNLIQLVTPALLLPFPIVLTIEFHLSLVADSMERATVDSKAPVPSALLSGCRLATCHFTDPV